MCLQVVYLSSLEGKPTLIFITNPVHFLSMIWVLFEFKCVFKRLYLFSLEGKPTLIVIKYPMHRT